MKRRIIGILVCMLLLITLFPINATAGDEENPEIEDDTWQIWDLIKGFNILSAWFSNDDINLYVSIKMADIQPRAFFASTVIWTYNEVQYFASFQGNHYYFGNYNNNIYLWEYKDATGTLEIDKNIITIIIPLNEIDNPSEGEKLTSTWAMSHWGLIGLNFHFPLDRAPNWGTYGKDYIIGNS